MALVTGSIPHFVNGISQQPQEMRLPTQADAQVNFHSTAADGLRQRPPTLHVARLGAALPAASFVHPINRDATERYVAVFGPGKEIKVFGADGTRKVVRFDNDKARRYLATGSTPAVEGIKAVTVADYTFVVNRTVKVEMADGVSASRKPEALIAVKAGNYGREYRVVINNSTAAVFRTPDGSEPEHVEEIDTAHIARSLMAKLKENGYGAGKWRINVVGGETIWLRRTDRRNFSIRVDDGYNGAAMVACKNIVQKFSDLPQAAPDGFLIQVAGDDTNGFDNYYVRFDEDNGGRGVWKEGVAGGERNRLNPYTMPHILVREEDGTFTFKQAEWRPRRVGDPDLNPTPSFVGQTISDVFFEANRLGLASDEGVVLSKAGEFFDFWRDTVVTLLDEDPVDVSATHTQVTLIEHAAPLNGDIILVSAQNQLRFTGGQLITAKTAAIKPISSFEVQTNVRPALAGSTLILPTSAGSWTNLLDYGIDSETNTAVTEQLTAHVPRYIPKPLRHLLAVPNFDTIIAVSREASSKLFVYKSLVNDQRQRIQSAWSEWDLGEDADILSAAVFDDFLFLVINRAGDGLYLEKMPLSPAYRDDWVEDTLGAIHLDRRVLSDDLPAPVWHSGPRLTTFKLPYHAGRMKNGEPISRYVGVRRDGRVLQPVKVEGKKIWFRGNLTDVDLWIGARITCSYRLSRIYPRKQDRTGAGSTAITTGRLTLLRGYVNFSESSSFRVDVRTARTSNSYRCVADDRWDPLAGGGARLRSGKFKFPIYALNTEAEITLTTDSVFQVRLLSADWEGRYDARARSI